MYGTLPTASGRTFRLLALGCLLLIGGCVRMPSTGITALKVKNTADLQSYLLTHRADVDQFRLRGPFEVTTIEDRELRLSAAQRITGDLYLASPKEKAPLVILLHGYGNSKDDHAYQAMHLASWGIHCLSLQLPNKGPWVGNGRTTARLVDLIRKNPELIDSRVDPEKIILAGHSFGGYAVTVALAEGAPAMGGVLLDPAGLGKDLPIFLRKVDKPLMLLGADEERVSVARGRESFYRLVRGGIAEISIRGAAHEDAQFGVDGSPFSNGDSHTEEHQITFVSALTAAAFSLAATGKFDYAWTSFDDAIRNGRLVNPKKK
jgi:pimeloyl-ACP methyl ester carboxylesterase